MQRRSGNNNQRTPQDSRTNYEHDHNRVIHCPAFRRLQYKTQILDINNGDFHRTRLTHSLEVASIGRSIVHYLRIKYNNNEVYQNLLPPDDLMSVICLVHDIGHPAFGHGGEVALNFMMRAHGGFESNSQTLRLLTKIEDSYNEHYGLDLTRRALLGILKYPANYSRVLAINHDKKIQSHQTICFNNWLPAKSYFDDEINEVTWLLAEFTNDDQELFQTLAFNPEPYIDSKTIYKTFDCSIMNIADDIAYGVHDLEDAIHLNLINRDQFDNQISRQLFNDTQILNTQELLQQLFSTKIHEKKQAIGEIVNFFITNIEISITNENFNDLHLKYNASLPSVAQKLLDYLQQYIYNNVIDSQTARIFEYNGQSIISNLFKAISSNPLNLLDNKNRQRYLAANNINNAHRIICDYLANMTNDHAYRIHGKLFGMNKCAL